jgi:RHS repeat-associated protein
MRMNIGANTTHFPNQYFTKVFPSFAATAHVLLNGRTVATITGTSTASTTLYYVYSDNLGSADVTADSNNRVQEVTDYSPYGSISNHDQLAGYTEERKFTGQEYDSTTNYNYMNARYQDPVRGQFISEDPLFVTQDKSNLKDPQSLNSYSYAKDNPIRYTDPTGKLTATQSAAIGAVIAAFNPSSSGQFAALAGLVGSFIGTTVSNASGVVQNALGSASNYVPSTNPSTYINGVKNGEPYFTGAVVAGGIALSTAAVAGGIAGAAALGSFNAGTVGYTCLAFCQTVGDSIGKDYGKLGTVVQSTPGTINLINNYASGRLLERGLTADQATSTVDNPLIKLSQDGGQRFLYLNPSGGAVVDTSGRLITGYSAANFEPHVLEPFRDIGTFIWR